MSVVASNSPRRSRAALWVALASLAALGLVIGVRFKEAAAERKTFSAGAPAVAGGEPTARDAPALAVVRGVSTIWQPSVALTGTLAPIRETDLSFKMTGRLVSVRVKVGDKVKSGQALALLDSTEPAAQHAAANAQVHAAEVRLAIARDNEQRSRALFEQNAVSGSQHLADQQKADLAQAELEAARAQAQTAAATLKNTQVIAPFAGRVTQAPDAPGAIVTPGAPLFRIEDTTALRLRATVSVEDVSLVSVGALVRLDASGRSGRVTAVLPSVDPQTRRVPIVAEIPNQAAPPLLAGVFVRATITTGEPISVLRLPASTLRPGSQDEVVLLKAGKLRRARVVFARGDDGALWVREGLRPDEDVVLSPSAAAADGADVSTVPVNRNINAQ